MSTLSRSGTGIPDFTLHLHLLSTALFVLWTVAASVKTVHAKMKTNRTVLLIMFFMILLILLVLFFVLYLQSRFDRTVTPDCDVVAQRRRHKPRRRRMTGWRWMLAVVVSCQREAQETKNARRGRASCGCGIRYSYEVTEPATDRPRLHPGHCIRVLLGRLAPRPRLHRSPLCRNDEPGCCASQ